MRRGLERIRALDANVEKDGAKEIKYDKDSYDYLFDEDELLMIQQMQLREKLIAEGYLAEDDKISYEDSKLDKREMDEMIAESMQCWDSRDLGKYTIGTPTQEKQGARSIEQSLEISGKEFEELANNMEIDDAELQAEYERMAEELEGIF